MRFTPIQTASGWRRLGSVTAQVAVCLTVLLSVTAITLDGGVLQDQRRQVQAGADAAALGAAKDLFDTYVNMDLYDNGKDTGKAKDHALAIAAANSYTNDGTQSIVTVNIPPKTGPYKDRLGHVEVIIEYRQRRYFSTIFGKEDIPVRARAVARGTYEPKAIGILVLDPTKQGSLTLAGQAIGIVKDAGVVVNSSHQYAGYGEGSGASLTATVFQLHGGVNANAQEMFHGPIYVGYPPMPDPYRDLPQPKAADYPLQSLATATIVDHGSGYKSVTLKPGRYIGGLSFDGKTSVTMEPGIYCMEGNSTGGGFKFKGNEATQLKAEGVMLFNDRGSNTETNPDSLAYPQISITGQALVKWTPPTEGLYKNFTFFQARGQDPIIAIAGQGGMDIRGTYYATGALLDISGGGINTIGSQLVSRYLTMRGNGTFTVEYDPIKIPPVRSWKLVE